MRDLDPRKDMNGEYQNIVGQGKYEGGWAEQDFISRINEEENLNPEITVNPRSNQFGILGNGYIRHTDILNAIIIYNDVKEGREERELNTIPFINSTLKNSRDANDFAIKILSKQDTQKMYDEYLSLNRTNPLVKVTSYGLYNKPTNTTNEKFYYIKGGKFEPCGF